MSTTSSSSREDRLEGERRRLRHQEVTMFPPPSYDETCTYTTNPTPGSGSARGYDGPASNVYQVQAEQVARGRIWPRLFRLMIFEQNSNTVLTKLKSIAIT